MPSLSIFLILLKELNEGVEIRSIPRFFDSNKDGQLSRNELPSRAKRLAMLDSNQDGFISKEEMTNRVPRKQ